MWIYHSVFRSIILGNVFIIPSTEGLDRGVAKNISGSVHVSLIKEICVHKLCGICAMVSTTDRTYNDNSTE